MKTCTINQYLSHTATTTLIRFSSSKTVFTTYFNSVESFSTTSETLNRAREFRMAIIWWLKYQDSFIIHPFLFKEEKEGFIKIWLLSLGYAFQSNVSSRILSSLSPIIWKSHRDGGTLEILWVFNSQFSSSWSLLIQVRQTTGIIYFKEFCFYWSWWL